MDNTARYYALRSAMLATAQVGGGALSDGVVASIEEVCRQKYGIPEPFTPPSPARKGGRRSRLSRKARAEIRTSTDSPRKLAAKYGVSRTYIYALRQKGKR